MWCGVKSITHLKAKTMKQIGHGIVIAPSTVAVTTEDSKKRLRINFKSVRVLIDLCLYKNLNIIYKVPTQGS